MKTFFIFMVFITCGMYLFMPAFADELSDLKYEMLKIQEKNEELQQQIEKQNSLMMKLSEKINVLEQKEKVITESVEELNTKEFVRENDNHNNYESLPLNEQLFGPKLDLKGFADISYKIENDVGDGKQNYNSFALGQLDMFITSALSENISVLSETVFEHGEDNDLEIEVERLEMKYSFSDLFNIKIGRMHTALGFWNTEYHHSTWLHTSASRPLIFTWEDEGGIIPNHFVGLYLFGKKDFDSFDFEYDIGVANGRGRTVHDIQNLQDRNDSKAFNARFQVAPSFLPSLNLGFTAYSDKIPSNPADPNRKGEIDELILGAHIIYFKNNLELLAEIIHLNHRDEQSHNDFGTYGYYVQVAYQFSILKPFYRFDLLDLDKDDPFYQDDHSGDITEHILGVRWDPIIWNSIKLEYKYSDRDDFNDEHSITVQSTFSF